MKQKIEWYREVLELEPGSRVFFPLAKLLAEDGQAHDAIITLRQGVLRHPDHVEARLLLVELLSSQGATSDLKAEVERLGTLFASYPGFWKAWSKTLAANPAMQDAALAIRFFSAALQGQSLTWASIIEHGLQALLHGAADELPVQAKASSLDSDVALPEQEDQAAAPDIEANELEYSTPESETFEQATAAPQVECEEEEEDAFDSAHADTDVDMDADGEQDEDESEEAFSLRTRSMAEVLAEQGDIAGALDIYQELIAVASEEDKVSLKARAEELSRHITTGASAQEPAVDKSEGAAKDGNRLIGLLESLAERLEARAR